jgi:hypothetical protein
MEDGRLGSSPPPQYLWAQLLSSEDKQSYREGDPGDPCHRDGETGMPRARQVPCRACRECWTDGERIISLGQGEGTTPRRDIDTFPLWCRAAAYLLVS